jgi:hypothetical protein
LQFSLQAASPETFGYTLVYIGLPSGFFPSGFPTTILNAFLIYPMHATCPLASHFIFNLIKLVTGGKEYNLWSSSGNAVFSKLHLYVVYKFAVINALETLYCKELFCSGSVDLNNHNHNVDCTINEAPQGITPSKGKGENDELLMMATVQI